MAQTNKIRVGLAVCMALGIGLPAHASTQQTQTHDPGLAVAALADGKSLAAISQLEVELKQDPSDPALLINLGIAYAQSGDEIAAHAHFEAALRSRQVIDLDTANGRTTDSRKLARVALAMLARGEF
ncbi:MAG: hypothetical protein AAGI28_03380, partial [Pseudomonadota bacterium]